MKNKIGFRVKIKGSNLKECEIRNIFKLYFKEYDILELKLSQNLISNDELIKIIEESKVMPEDSISIHLPSELLVDIRDIKKYNELFQLLNKIKFHDKFRFVTHMPCEINEQQLINDIKQLVRLLPNNSQLMIENPSNIKNIEEYIISMDSLFEKLNFTIKEKVFLCLDIGHLLYSGLKSGVMIDNILNTLDSKKEILNNIREIHIHDYNDEVDHLNLGTGRLEIKKVMEFLQKHNINMPIIIEVSLRNVFIDGKEQVNLLKNNIS